ncbi:uncharacterized protein LOC126561716 [Anopheles maculipalpis]|uniref:uncharacterized protein LOC126561716 n=1 Tax=Anopheles maculipalpis TaxID=1496333 RepID=UPI0021594642|nr:uncharacterized protein LOC126561716 [Anopheles maculipalpis]
MVLRVQPTGHLYLDWSRKYCVHRELVSKLAIHQLEAVRFLYTQLHEYTGIFLNDESGLGKCYQTVAFLSALAVTEDHSLILCPTHDRLHHWRYHLDVLAPSLRTKVQPKSYLDISSEQSTLRETDWQYVVVDETREFMSEKQLETLRSLAVKRYIFVCSVDLLEQLDVLLKRLDFCYPRDPTHLRKVIEQQQKQRSKKGSFKVYLCTRLFILRRHASNYRRTLPLIERRAFVEHFRAWSVANNIEVPIDVTPATPEASREDNNSTASSIGPLSKTMTPDAMGQEQPGEQDDTPLSPVRCGQGDNPAKQTSPDHANEAVPLHYVDSEPLFEPNETNTELMPALRIESDTLSEYNSIPETSGTIPETAPDSQGYMQFGQEILSHGYSSSQPSQQALATERYRFPIEKFLRSQGQLKSSSSSLSVESIPNGQPVPPVTEIVISSSDSPQPIAKSPPLFDDSDHDTKSLNSCSSDDDDDSLMELLATSRTMPPIEIGGDRVPSPSIVPRRHPSFSTPITKLMFGPLAGADGVSQQLELGNVSSVDIFAESLVGAAPAAAGDNADNVFEITKNNAFPNRIIVHDEEDGNASLQLVDDSSNDEVQIVDVTEGRIINLIEDVVSTPESPDQLKKAVVCQKTPPSGGGINRMLSPGRGWLGKGLRTASVSPASGKNSPSTSGKPSPVRAGCSSSGGGGVAGTKGKTPIVRDAKRRRKLDDVFQTVHDTKRGRNSQRRGSGK